jgi:hypothetical protein
MGQLAEDDDGDEDEANDQHPEDDVPALGGGVGEQRGHGATLDD